MPCPVDPSHQVYEDQVEKHVKVCPYIKKQRSQQEQSYYRYNVNGGGHGRSSGGAHESTTPSKERNVQWARQLALKILQVHQRIFLGSELPEEDVRHVSLQDVVEAIPMMDLSKAELQAGLKSSVDHYRIKCGGERHLHQQGSLIGHLRRLGVFDNTESNLTLLEMGAGRGMFGLMAAGVVAAAAAATSQTTTASTQLILVERSGSRSKADGVLRMAKDATDYMALNQLQFSRITCDLAHVHMPTALVEKLVVSTNYHDEATNIGNKRKHDNQNNKIVVIAKHLCGAGTDLALKSLQDVDVQQQVDACVMATCCHGVCSWEQYVGRDFLRTLFGNDFGQAEFDLLRRWSSGTVATGCCADKTAPNNDDEHGKCIVDDGKDPMSVASIIQSLGLGCGHEGLGRACQRLLDHGRLEFMRQMLFSIGECQVEMFHYVPSTVTPQNAVLVARRK